MYSEELQHWEIGQTEIHNHYQCLHNSVLEENILGCMLLGFPCISCLSMKHVADGRRGCFLLHQICLLQFSFSNCEDTLHLQAQ